MTKILHRYTGQLLFEFYGNTKATVEAAVKAGADLTGANLTGANKIKMSPDTRIETGETWKEYIEEVVPALIAAGGHAVTEKAWACHTWDNCPMAEAFGVHKIADAPTLLRPRINQFVRYYDAGLIPMPECVRAPQSGGA